MSPAEGRKVREVLGSMGRCVRKFSQTLKSFLLLGLRVTGLHFKALDKSEFKLNLNVFRNGHIEEMKLSLPATASICRVDTIDSFSRFTISDIVFHFLSAGRLQDSVRVLKYIPRTFPSVEHPKALSKFGHGFASSMFNWSQMFL